MSNKLCLFKRGHFREPEMCSVWLKIGISNNSYQYSFVIASVDFNIYRVTTHHTPKCVENCSDSKVSYNCLSNFYQTFCNLGYNSENSMFFLTVDYSYFVMNRSLSCAQTVALDKQQKCCVKSMWFKRTVNIL